MPSWPERLVRVLDDGLRIPGTPIRLGADAIVGLLLPGVGDAISSLASVVILWLGFKERVPKVVLARMALNVATDGLVGAVPVLGDVFDVAFKANRRNLTLIERHRAAAAPKPTPGDYAVIGLGLVLALGVALLPFVVLAWLVSRLGGLGNS